MKNKKSNLERAAEIGVSIPTLNSWKRCGVDIYDDQQVKSRIAKMRNIPPDLKPEWIPQVPPLGASIDSSIGGDMDDLKKQLANCSDKHQAQTIKLKIDGALALHKLAVQRGEYIRADEVKSEGVRIGLAVSTVFAKMPDELPPLLAGHDSAKIKKILTNWQREKRTELSLHEGPVKITN